MDLPPLDDARWDLLLDAVIGEQPPGNGQRPTTMDPSAVLATPFPAALRRAAAMSLDEPSSDAPTEDAYA